MFPCCSEGLPTCGLPPLQNAAATTTNHSGRHQITTICRKPANLFISAQLFTSFGRCSCATVPVVRLSGSSNTMSTQRSPEENDICPSGDAMPCSSPNLFVCVVDAFECYANGDCAGFPQMTVSVIDEPHDLEQPAFRSFEHCALIILLVMTIEL